MDVKGTEEKLTKLLATLKKNRDHVPLEELHTRYKKPYDALCQEIKSACSDYLTAVCFHDFRCNKRFWEECLAVILQAKEDSRIMPQISRALFQRQSMTEVKELSEKLRNAYQEALAPFFEKYICLLLSPECFDEPPAIPLIFNEATGCIYENGAWILESDEPQGGPLHVNPLQEAAES